MMSSTARSSRHAQRGISLFGLMAWAIVIGAGSYVVLRTKRYRMAEILSTGRTIDRVVRTDDGLRFAERRVIFDNDLIPNSLIAPI